MATKSSTATAEPEIKPNMMTSDTWGEVEALDGADVVDKTELIGTPFLISAFKFNVNDRGIVTAWVEVENEDGETFTFTDSSTGVKKQLQDFRDARPSLEADEDGYYETRLLAPKGLRVSTYTTKDERGRDREARTFYLTTAGRRRKS